MILKIKKVSENHSGFKMFHRINKYQKFNGFQNISRDFKRRSIRDSTRDFQKLEWFAGVAKKFSGFQRFHGISGNFKRFHVILQNF